METPFSLYLLSPEQFYPDEMKIVTQLFNLGLEVYHVRKPSLSLKETRSLLQSLPADFHKRIVLHAHFSLANEFNLKGIHLNETNKKFIAELAGYNIVSSSFHSLATISQNQYPYQYIFLSPVFDSISKPGYSANFELSSLKTNLTLLKQTNPTPHIIALGGVNSENISLVRQTGFSGAALLGAVWQSVDPVRTFSEIQSAVQFSN